uniref:RDRP C-terminal head domain-containing protein n=1 Tax=Leersia perrieri TaxID=77586 RepID=A0A0D9UXX8_9ORYZ
MFWEGISLLPCFAEIDAPLATKHLWQHRYKEYLTDSRLLLHLSENYVARCCFAWNVAGRALCHFYAFKNVGDTVPCSLPLLRNFKFIKKYRK